MTQLLLLILLITLLTTLYITPGQAIDEQDATTSDAWFSTETNA